MKPLTVLAALRAPIRLFEGPEWLGWTCIIVGFALLALGMLMRWWRR